MKTRKITHSKSNLLKLQLLKSKVYKKKNVNNNFDNSPNVILEQTELEFKTAINIIYKYHINKKKIFFVGIPLDSQKKFENFLKKTKHLSIPETVWIDGILSNRKSIFQYFKLLSLRHIKKPNYKIKKIKPLFYINKNPDLIIVINPNIEKNTIKETNRLKIPIIELNSFLFYNDQISYKISGNFRLTPEKFYNNICVILDILFNNPNQ